MPIYADLHDGRRLEFPDGTDPAVIQTTVKKVLGKPASTEAGEAINGIPRQVGLTARYAAEGLANVAEIGTEPIRNAAAGLRNAVPTKGDGGYQSPLMMDRKPSAPMRPLGQAVTSLATSAGLPSPQGADERTVAQGTRLMAGAGGLAAAGRAAQAVPGVVGQVGEFFSANVPAQITSAAGAGLAGGASAEAGGGKGMQAGASLLGGVAGGLAPGLVTSLVAPLRALIQRGASPQQIDQQISVLLQRADVDYSQLPEAVRSSLRTDLANMLQAGRELNPQAVARLADFRRIGATPTRGMVSQNPVQITREMNLAKIGANTADDTLQGLPLIQNQNNNVLIRNLNQAGASRGDPFRAGQAAVGGIQGRDAAMEQGVSALYRQARDTSGRAAELDRSAFSRRASELLDEAMVGGALPKDVENKINWIAANTHPSGNPMPFNVDIAEQLKTQIAKLQRNTSDGSARHALGLVRQALDETPLMSAPKVNPSNLPAMPGTVPPSPAALGQDSINAFNQARDAARQRFQWRESARPIEAAVNGAQPDRFVQQFVLGGTLDDARAVAQNAPVQEVKDAILAHLKDRALNGAADEVGKFSQSAYNKALRDIGERKLALFFTPEEVGQLQSVGRVASYTQVQPVGSAVNNSNTGALMLGKGYDALMALSNKLPVLGPMLVPPVRNIEISLRNRQAQNALAGVLAPQAQSRPPVANNLLLPLLLGTGSLTAPTP